MTSPSSPKPRPEATFGPDGSITFPTDGVRVLRDWAYLTALRPAPCPGGYQCVVLPGKLMMAFLCQPEQVMVVGCVAHMVAFAADRGEAKRKRSKSFLDSGLMVAHPQLLGQTGAPSSEQEATMITDILIGQWVARSSGPRHRTVTKWHLIDSAVDGGAFTRCGRRMKDIPGSPLEVVIAKPVANVCSVCP